MSTILAGLGEALLKAGAPLLKDVVTNSIGGVGGKIAGAAIDALAENLGAPPTVTDAKKPEWITKKIEGDPEASAPVVRDVQDQFVKTMDMGTGSLDRYNELLLIDAKSEGLISRIWRPLFALTYTILFAIQVVTICWLLWSRQLGTLKEIGDITTFLTFLNIAGCAVLGIQIWKRTEEKKSGVTE